MKPNRSGVLLTLLAALGVVSIACSAPTGEAASPSAAAGESTVVARIGDGVITQEELDAVVKVKNAQAFQAFYDARRAVLEDLIRTRLLEAETKERGITEQELFAETTQGLPPVTDAEIQNFYNANTSRMGGRTLEQMSPQIRSYLENGARQTALNATIETLKEKYGVSLLLEPPRMKVQIAANDPSYGPEDAPIVLVEFSDFQ